jgi:hypothetical protein
LKEEERSVLFVWNTKNSEEERRVLLFFSSKPFKYHLYTCHTSMKETEKMEDKETGADLNSIICCDQANYIEVYE